MNVLTTTSTLTRQVSNQGRPSMPATGRQPVIERKMADPSSTAPKNQGYPIPSFFEYRIKANDYDPL